MNIVMFSEVSAARVIGGAERMLRGQAEGLHRRGHLVRLIVRAPAADPAPDVDIRGVREHRYPIGRGSEVSFFLSTLRNSLRAYDRLRRETPVDAVVIHQSLAGLGPALFRKQSARRWIYCCLSHAHEEYLTRNAAASPAGRPILSVKAFLRRIVERAAIRRCDCVMVLSAFSQERVTRFHGIRADRISIIEGAVDVSRFAPAQDRRAVRTALGLPAQGILLLSVRNLVPRMGLERLIEAVAQLRPAEAGLYLTIGGDGPLRQELQRRIDASGLQRQVRLAGFIPEDDLPRHLQAADCVVMPTAQLEGFGLVTVEAMACGTPVVGTPVGAIPEVLGRVDASLIAPGSTGAGIARALGTAIDTIRNNPDKWHDLGRRCRDAVLATYTWDRHCSRLLQLLAPAAEGAP